MLTIALLIGKVGDLEHDYNLAEFVSIRVETAKLL